MVRPILARREAARFAIAAVRLARALTYRRLGSGAGAACDHAVAAEAVMGAHVMPAATPIAQVLADEATLPERDVTPAGRAQAAREGSHARGPRDEWPLRSARRASTLAWVRRASPSVVRYGT